MKTPVISLLTLLFLLPMVGNSQNGNEEAQPIDLEKTTSWSDLMEHEGVKVQYKYQECHSEKNDVHKENVLLRFENTNQESVTVEWDHLLWYDGNCKTCGGDQEYRFSLELDAGSTKKGSCDLDVGQNLKVFARFLNPGNGRPDTELTGIRLAQMEVN